MKIGMSGSVYFQSVRKSCLACYIPNSPASSMIRLLKIIAGLASATALYAGFSRRHAACGLPQLRGSVQQAPINLDDVTPGRTKHELVDKYAQGSDFYSGGSISHWMHLPSSGHTDRLLSPEPLVVE
jgi:hypothetical protein